MANGVVLLRDFGFTYSIFTLRFYGLQSQFFYLGIVILRVSEFANKVLKVLGFANRLLILRDCHSFSHLGLANGEVILRDLGFAYRIHTFRVLRFCKHCSYTGIVMLRV